MSPYGFLGHLPLPFWPSSIRSACWGILNILPDSNYNSASPTKLIFPKPKQISFFVRGEGFEGGKCCYHLHVNSYIKQISRLEWLITNAVHGYHLTSYSFVGYFWWISRWVSCAIISSGILGYFTSLINWESFN